MSNNSYDVTFKRDSCRLKRHINYHLPPCVYLSLDVGVGGCYHFIGNMGESSQTLKYRNFQC